MKPIPESTLQRVFEYPFEKIYSLYLQKILRKNRTQYELDSLIIWLTGYTRSELTQRRKSECSMVEFVEQSPEFNPQSKNIKGMICGYRIEEIENQSMKKIRYLDKLVDELAKGKTIEKIIQSYQ